MMRASWMVATLAGLAIGAAGGGTASAQSYAAPAASRDLLARVDWAAARPVDEAYRQQFVRCDGLAPGRAGVDTFMGHRTPRRCSTDPSRVAALLRLADGGIAWQSKMALDVDGSVAATGGRTWRDGSGRVRSTTDQCGTALKWRRITSGDDCRNADAQVDPDKFPYVVIPAGGTGFLPAPMRGEARRRFGTATGLALGDMGVVVHAGRWVPVFVADTGPVFRLGEGSAAVFAALGQPRCRAPLDARGQCSGDGSDRYPYRDAGIASDVVFILYPGSGEGLTRDNALTRICAFAERKLGLTDAAACPPAR